MRSMPTLGPAPKRGPFSKVLVIALLAGGVAGTVYWFKHRRGAPAVEAPGPTVAAPLPEDAGLQGVVAAAPTPDDPLKKAGLGRANIRVDGPLETALVGAVGKEVGGALTQVVTRTLVWWVSVPGDLRKGDQLDILFEERPAEEPVVHAVRFVSGKFGKTFAAYRFKPDKESFPRYYQASGEELEERIEDSPLDNYEQITSLLRDGRKHKGVDFKVPVNTPVKATFAGTITRKNWSFRGNGNCLELSEAGGHRKALYLHLSELPRTLQVGKHVARGEVIATSGNTGHSFAPHLHYQLMSGERVLDPFESHKSFRRTIEPVQKAALDEEVRRLEGLLNVAVAGNN